MLNLNDNTNEYNNIESKLLSYQIPHLYQLYESFQVNKCVLDASDTGTGKTYVALALCNLLKLKPFIICPKSVICSWQNVAKQLNIEIFGVSNYESLINSKYYTSNMEKVKCPYMDKENEIFVFYFPHDIIIIFDEAHRCKNYKSITSKLLLSITKSNNKILLLSATITDKIECFKPFGVVFGLYSEHHKFKSWLRRQFNMMKVQYKNIKLSKKLCDKISLDIIHKTIFPHKGSRIKIKELGDLFPKNQMTANLYYCKNHEEIDKMYDLVNDAIKELKIKEKKAEALAKLIFARMKIELLKIPIFIDLAQDAIDNGYSVVIFTNFKETLHNLADKLNTDCLILGEQNMEERQECIEDFQSNKKKVLITMMQCGGVGLSLHDIQGNNPRISLINPSWNGIEMKQALGRIHRAGAKTPALQRIIYCAQTYEEQICDLIDQKLKTIGTINDGDLYGKEIEKEILDEINKNAENMLKKINEKEEKMENKKKKTIFIKCPNNPKNKEGIKNDIKNDIKKKPDLDLKLKSNTTNIENVSLE